MSDYLQKHFQEEAVRQSHLKLLESQWSFDQKLIPKVLQQVGQLFPHYSRHDQSHSEQILINIERLLGESRIKLLSATDIWFLLEAAYWHDIGMVVPHQALKDALENPEFQNYRRQVASDSGHELQKFALHFDSTDLSKTFAGAQSPLDAVDKFRLLMAEWFRRQHPNRSEKSVNDPWQELGLNSPRTELIPKRLFRLLGRICALHGAAFVDVLDQLPHKEVGMSNDDCHPRFVACLLRLGDLLDMDDNRFCPVMQRIAGDNRPALSKAHEDKHNSIRHFRLDSNRIEISAVCESIDGYVEQWRWLGYLRSEMQSQMACWQDIAPSPELGLLPTLGEVKVDIAGKHLITKPGTRPEFGLNADRAMKLLKGDNLYQHEDTIRELLQNAVDATLLHIWLISKCEGQVVGNMPNELSESYFKKFPIQACVERIIDLAFPVNAEKNKWRFTVIDQGIGISQEDLPYLMNVASSATNMKRQSIIEEMPEWLQPSGTFGIGLQSVFMWTDVVRIKTKSLQTNEMLDITLHNPTGPQHGMVTVELAENSYLHHIGTELSFDFVTEKCPSHFSISESQSVTYQAYINYDRLLDKEWPIKVYQICDAVLEFSKHSPIDVNWLFRNVNEEFKFLGSTLKKETEQGDFFYQTNSRCTIQLGLDLRSSLRYRGQEVKNAKLPSYYLFGYSLDLYAGKAGDWLTFNRNNITSEGTEKISAIIGRNLKLWIEKHENELLNENKPLISILAKLWVEASDSTDERNYWAELTKKIPDDWLNNPCTVTSKNNVIETKTYQDILVKDMVLDDSHRHSYSIIYDLNEKEVAQTNRLAPCLTNYCVQKWSDNTTHGIRYIKVGITEFDNNLTFSLLIQLIEISENQKRLDINESTLSFAIEQSIKQNEGNFRLLIPLMLFPENLKMERLILKDDIRSSGFRYVLKYLPEQPVTHILLPYEILSGYRYKSSIALNRLDEFVKWVNSNLKEPLSLPETRFACNDLINYIDNTLMNESEYWKSLRK